MHRESRQSGLSLGFNVVVGALVLLGGAFVAYLATKEYEAIAWLKVSDDPAAILSHRDLRHGDGYELAQYRKTQAALIKSPVVLRAAINDPALAQVKLIQNQADPEQWLKDNLQIKFPLESEVMQVTLKARNKADGVKIVNAVVDSYFNNVVDQERHNRARAFDRFDKEVKTLMAEIAEKQALLTELSPQAQSDILREEIKRKQALAHDLEEKMGQLQVMGWPDRVTRLMDASE